MLPSRWGPVHTYVTKGQRTPPPASRLPHTQWVQSSRQKRCPGREPTNARQAKQGHILWTQAAASRACGLRGAIGYTQAQKVDNSHKMTCSRLEYAEEAGRRPPTSTHAYPMDTHRIPSAQWKQEWREVLHCTRATTTHMYTHRIPSHAATPSKERRPRIRAMEHQRLAPAKGGKLGSCSSLATAQAVSTHTHTHTHPQSTHTHKHLSRGPARHAHRDTTCGQTAARKHVTQLHSLAAAGRVNVSCFAT